MKNLILICFLSLCFQESSAAPITISRPVDFIEFRLFYPYPKLNSSLYSTRTKTSLGMDLNYQLFQWSENIGIVFNPGAWLLPLNTPSSQRTLGAAHFLMGVNLCPFPQSWPNPNIGFHFGPAFGHFQKSNSLFYEANLRLSMGIYSIRQRFADPRLALTLSAGASKFWNHLEILRGDYFDVGLGLKGSF